MTIAMMLTSAAISIVFLLDFTRTICELQRQRVAMKVVRSETGGFRV